MKVDLKGFTKKGRENVVKLERTLRISRRLESFSLRSSQQTASFDNVQTAANKRIAFSGYWGECVSHRPIRLGQFWYWIHIWIHMNSIHKFEIFAKCSTEFFLVEFSSFSTPHKQRTVWNRRFRRSLRPAVTAIQIESSNSRAMLLSGKNISQQRF